MEHGEAPPRSPWRPSVLPSIRPLPHPHVQGGRLGAASPCTGQGSAVWSLASCLYSHLPGHVQGGAPACACAPMSPHCLIADTGVLVHPSPFKQKGSFQRSTVNKLMSEVFLLSPPQCKYQVTFEFYRHTKRKPNAHLVIFLKDLE